MKNYTLKTFRLTRISSVLFLLTFLVGSASQSNAQALYQTAAIADFASIKTKSIDPSIKTFKETNSEASYLVKDGLLDAIYNLKFVLANVQLKVNSKDSIIGEKDITFEQTQVMVLPIMGMAHFVGSLKIGDVSNSGSLLLKFKVNSDQSVSFIGEKTVKLMQYDPNGAFKVTDEVKFDINFVIKNTKNSATSVTAEE